MGSCGHHRQGRSQRLQSMKRPDEPIEVTIERYVIGYLVFWHIALLIKKR